MTVRIRVLKPGDVREFEFDRDTVSVGRGPRNDVVVGGAGVGRRHGVLRLESDGVLHWACGAMTTLMREGEPAARSDGDESEWEIVVGDVLALGESESVSIEVTAVAAPGPTKPLFLAPDAVDADGPVAQMTRLARRLAASSDPAPLLEAFDQMLDADHLQRSGPTTLVFFSGPDDFHNDAWVVQEGASCACMDPMIALGATGPGVLARWATDRAAAVVGEAVLIPFGEDTVRAAIVCRPKHRSPESLRALVRIATQVGPFVELFAARRDAEREMGLLTAENSYFRARQRQHYLFKELVRESATMRSVYEQISALANTDHPVLLLGEAGTGKELLARLLHHSGARADQMILRVNCAEFGDERANIELFGSTIDDEDASGPRKGVFELARSGTVFLDEVDVLAPMVQAKLCRSLKEGEVRRVGDSVGRPIRCRIVASLHRDVAQCLDEGRLRRDLWLLLKEHCIGVPSLRERSEDIELLAENFRVVYANRYGRHVTKFSEAARQKLQSHSWPGNVRELQSRIEAAVLGARGDTIEASDLGLV